MNDKNPKQSDSAKKPSRRRYLIAVGMFLLVVFAVCLYLTRTFEPKPDPASEAIIRQSASRNLYYKTQRESDPNILILDLLREKELAKDPNTLTDEDFLKIERISIGYPYLTFDQRHSSMELCDIKLLKKFTNLKSLYIGSVYYPPNKIPRWMFLLEKLGILNLEERFALDLKPIKKLKNLEDITIHNTTVKNFKTLENMTNLRELSIIRTNISDLEPLENLINLTTLDFINSDVKNIEPLKKLKNLKSVNLTDCPNITDKQIEDLQKALPELKIRR